MFTPRESIDPSADICYKKHNYLRQLDMSVVDRDIKWNRWQQCQIRQIYELAEKAIDMFEVGAKGVCLTITPRTTVPHIP